MFPVWNQFQDSMSWRFPDQLGGAQGQEKSKEAWQGGQEARLGGQEAWLDGLEAWSGSQEVQTEPGQPPASQKVARRYTWP